RRDPRLGQCTPGSHAAACRRGDPPSAAALRDRQGLEAGAARRVFNAGEHGHGALIVTMHDDLSGRVTVVTGASSGIGEATARLFAAHGATVVVGYHRDRAAAERVVAGLPPGEHMAVQITIDDGASGRGAAETG